jgi:hypothetical protein
MGSSRPSPCVGDYRPLSVRIQLPGARFVSHTGKSVGVPVRCGPCDKATGAGADKAPSVHGCGPDIGPLAASMPALRLKRETPSRLRSRCGDTLPI